MGEGDEQTPLAIAQDMPFLEWSDPDPDQEELNILHLTFETDLFHQMLCNTPCRSHNENSPDQ